MQHVGMVPNQHTFTQLEAPARPPFPVKSSSTQGMRASSNPEYGQPQSHRGPLRFLPGPPGQFSSPQDRFPLQRYTPSTEVLEYIHPGSTSRGDFHSDSTAHNALDTFSSGPLNDYVAITVSRSCWSIQLPTTTASDPSCSALEPYRSFPR